jgi:hypothetical protein
MHALAVGPKVPEAKQVTTSIGKDSGRVNVSCSKLLPIRSTSLARVTDGFFTDDEGGQVFGDGTRALRPNTLHPGARSQGFDFPSLCTTPGIF